MQLASRVCSVEGVRSPVGNRPQAAQTGHAREQVHFFSFRSSIHYFGNLTGSLPL
jgi:hypothetical protein